MAILIDWKLMQRNKSPIRFYSTKIKKQFDCAAKRLRLLATSTKTTGYPWNQRESKSTSVGSGLRHAAILPDGTNVNHTLVRESWCWWYRKYASQDNMLERLEVEARETKKGLWADPQLM